jgi:hypothetical protein
MAEARTRSERIRSRAAVLFAAGYVLALASFWLAGIAAYAVSGHGLSKLLGLAYFPILLLPIVGEKTLGGVQIHSTIWLWWFALQMILGVVAIWLYPHDRSLRRRPYPPRVDAPDSRAVSRSLARMPRI